MASNSSRNRSTRAKKPSAKATESTEDWKKPLDLSQKWCKIYCEEDAKCHTVSAKNLEPEDSEVLTESDLAKGNTVLWKFQGKKYTTTILEVYGQKPLSDNPNQRATKRSRSKRALPLGDSDASDTDSDGSIVKSKLKSKKCKGLKIYGVSSDSEVDSPTNGVITTVAAAPAAVIPMAMTCNCNCREDISILKNMVSDLSKNFTGLGELQTKVGKIYTYVKQSRSSHAAMSSSVLASPSAASPSSTVKTENDDKYISDSGVHLLSIRALNPSKYALALMDAIFTDDQMAACCFSVGKRTSKPQLPQEKVKLLEDCIDRKYGEGTLLKYESEIKKKCNQKCIDVFNKRIKKENPTPDKKKSVLPEPTENQEEPETQETKPETQDTKEEPDEKEPPKED